MHSRYPRFYVLSSVPGVGILYNASAAISIDGKHVEFGSQATNLVAIPADTNGVIDVFVTPNPQAP